MRLLIYFAIVLVSVCNAHEIASHLIREEPAKVADYAISVRNKAFYVGNPDEFGKIERPCEIYDINCIKRFFAGHGHCKMAHGPVPDPLYRAQSPIQYPRVNFTAIQTDILIYGLNGRISEFYINRVTDNLLIAIEFNDLNITAQNSYFEYFRYAKEPVYTKAYTTMQTSVTVTAIIPKINDLQLQRAEMTAYTSNPNPAYYIAPSAIWSSDPQPLRSYQEFLNNFPVNLQEYFVTEAPFFGAAYIQYNICDFKLKVT